MSAISRLNPNVIGIGSAQPAPPSAIPSSGSAAVKKVNLFDPSSLTTPLTLSLRGGQSVTLPAMSNEQAGQVQTLFSGLSPAEQGQVNDASDHLGAALFAAMQNSGSQPAQMDLGSDDDSDDDSSTGTFAAPASVSRALVGAQTMSRASITSTAAAGAGGSQYSAVSQAAPVSASASNAQLSAATSNAMSTYNNVKANQPYDNQVMATTYMGVSGIQSQMTAYAEGMQQRQNISSAVAADGSEFKQAVAEWPEGTSTQQFTYHPIAADGTVSTTTVTENLTKAQAQAKADAADGYVSSASDQSQLDQIKLQSMSQNYSNALNLMSNLMKASYDTVKNTVGNIHY